MAIEYANMNEEQRKSAEALADRFGVPAEIFTVGKLGKIVVNRNKMLKYMSAEDYNIIMQDGIKRSEITEEYRAEYRAKLKRDLAGLPKVKGLKNR